jgi:hypothetical protein
METLANGKAPGHDGIPIECFKTIKEDAVKILTKLCQQIQWSAKKIAAAYRHFLEPYL